MILIVTKIFKKYLKKNINKLSAKRNLKNLEITPLKVMLISGMLEGKNYHQYLIYNHTHNLFNKH